MDRLSGTAASHLMCAASTGLTGRRIDRQTGEDGAMAAVKQRRLRSSTVVLGGMGILALTITSCGSEPDKRCADRNTYEELSKSDCDSSGSGSYYYGGKSSNGRVYDGSFDKSTVDRGGFGCSGTGGG